MIYAPKNEETGQIVAKATTFPIVVPNPTDSSQELHK